MAALTLEGRISAKLAPQSGQSARGAWARQDFILEYPDGNFTSSACFTAWGQDKVAELDKFRVGDPVKVSFNVRAREYSGRWYNDLRIWKIEAAGADAPASDAPGHSPASAPQGFPAQNGGFASGSAQGGFASGASQGFAPSGYPAADGGFASGSSQGFSASDGGFASPGSAPQPPAFSAPAPTVEDMPSADLPEDDLPF